MKIIRFDEDKEFNFTEVSLKGEKKYYVEGYASTIDQDKAGEIITDEAQDDIVRQLNNEVITMDIEHEEWYDDDNKVLSRPKASRIPVAKIVKAERRPRGAWIKAEINKNLRNFNEVWGSISEGFLKAFSVAFYPVMKSGNKVSKLNIVNITLTGTPVNPHATFTAGLKSAVSLLNQSNEFQPNKEEKSMSEEEIKTVVPEVKAEKEETKADEEEDEDEKKKKSAKKEKPEAPEKDDAEEPEVKALPPKESKIEQDLKAELAKKDEEIVKLKAELARPVMKAVLSEPPKATKVEMKSSPLMDVA